MIVAVSNFILPISKCAFQMWPNHNYVLQNLESVFRSYDDNDQLHAACWVEIHISFKLLKFPAVTTDNPTVHVSKGRLYVIGLIVLQYVLISRKLHGTALDSVYIMCSGREAHCPLECVTIRLYEYSYVLFSILQFSLFTCIHKHYPTEAWKEFAENNPGIVSVSITLLLLPSPFVVGELACIQRVALIWPYSSFMFCVSFQCTKVSVAYMRWFMSFVVAFVMEFMKHEVFILFAYKWNNQRQQCSSWYWASKV